MGSSQNIVITELYRDPGGSESALCAGASHEFVEILNLGTDTFRIDKLFISDGMESDSVIALNRKIPVHSGCIVNQLFICPGQFALILDPDYIDAVQANSCALQISDSTVLLQTADRELGNGLSSDDGVVLYRGTKREIAEIIAAAADSSTLIQSPAAAKISLSSVVNREGFSIEPQGIISGKSYYAVSAEGITPGYLANFKQGYLVESSIGFPGDSGTSVSCTLFCRSTAENDKMSTSWELKGGTIPIANGTVPQLQNEWILALEIPLRETDYVFLLNGNCWPLDISRVWMPGSLVKINELLPRAVAGFEPEWFELVNTSAMTLNLQGWQYGNGEERLVLCTEQYMLKAGRHVVFVKDRRLFLQRYPGLLPVVQPVFWHVLNNYRDTLCIWDSRGILQDQIYYQNSWFVNWTDKSLERVSPQSGGGDSSSWVLSKESSPGFPNEAAFWRDEPKAEMEIGPLPFTPDGDGRNDMLCIKIKLPGYQKVKITILGFDGTLLYSFDGDPQARYFWNGKRQNGQYAVNGPFFVIAEFSGTAGTRCIRKKGILWR